MNKHLYFPILLLCVVLVFTAGCAEQQTAAGSPPADRESKIPAGTAKVTPQTDVSPPKSLSTDYKDPIPVKTINTAGAEDSAFITPDGNTLYFFFTPDVRVPPEKQVADGVSGIYAAKKVNGVWQKAQRVLLQDRGRLALDGCEYVSGDKMYFCSAREGYTGVHWFTAEFTGEKWRNWQNADFNPDFKVGELHMFNDELYYHSDREGGKGGLDIWVSKKVNNEWQRPQNVAAVNSPGNEGWPALSPDGNELWISRDYGLWRSKKVNGAWSSPELMISPLAGEATLDSQGNVYFTHHFYKDKTMIEADIYVAERRNQ